MTIRDRLNQFAEYQRTVRALRQLDNRQLADIGITQVELLDGYALLRQRLDQVVDHGARAAVHRNVR